MWPQLHEAAAEVPIAFSRVWHPRSFFSYCLCSLTMCSALISCSALLSSCSSSILVSLEDDKGTEIALHAVFRGVTLWFPGESKLASCLLVSFLGFFGFLFLLLSFETCMLKAQSHRKPSLTKPQQQNYHTPPPQNHLIDHIGGTVWQP